MYVLLQNCSTSKRNIIILSFLALQEEPGGQNRGGGRGVGDEGGGVFEQLRVYSGELRQWPRAGDSRTRTGSQVRTGEEDDGDDDDVMMMMIVLIVMTVLLMVVITMMMVVVLIVIMLVIVIMMMMVLFLIMVMMMMMIIVMTVLC